MPADGIVLLTFVHVKDTKNYALYQQEDGINKLYLGKGLPTKISLIVRKEDNS